MLKATNVKSRKPVAEDVHGGSLFGVEAKGYWWFYKVVKIETPLGVRYALLNISTSSSVLGGRYFTTPGYLSAFLLTHTRLRTIAEATLTWKENE